MARKETSKVLVVDSEPAILRTISTFLGLRGYDCACASSADEAAAWIERNTAHIILLDLDLDRSEGVGIVERLRRGAGFSQVVAMSAKTTVDKIVEAYGQGASDYLSKPFTKLDDIDVAVTEAAERLNRWRTILAHTLAEEGRP